MIPFLARINELSRKQAKLGLTDNEKVEQMNLRNDYLKLIRGQLLTNILAVSIIDSEGNDVTPSKLIAGKRVSKMIG